MFEDIIKVFIL